MNEENHNKLVKLIGFQGLDEKPGLLKYQTGE
jgi:hypothetical protein